MTKTYKESAFESLIEDCLLNRGGYLKGDTDVFDRERCIDPSLLLTFIEKTQPREWEYLKGIQKEETEETLLEDLCSALNSDHEGCLKVLRHGFKCFGKLFRVAYFAPVSGLNPEIKRLYDSNIMTVARQLRYSNKHNRTLDLVLYLNGIPVATAELKNPLTGQTWHNAIRQYKKDRDPNDLIFQFKKRSLVHFAVDPDEVYMTTRLAGVNSRFLPFNKGNRGGSGNPENPSGHKTAYLWQEIWERNSLLNIIGRFIHLELKERKIGKKKVLKETMIFPRYHQLDAVQRLIQDARTTGPGHNYLIQHSAGSGKSFSITWLAHHLATLHNNQDEKAFDSVVVVTDRRVLDQQLQDTIHQVEHRKGVVEKIDVDSNQLALALSTGSPIIITTLQKFPFIAERISELPAKNYAVIIDEAHSSQSGEMAAEMKGVLSAAQIRKEAASILEEGYLDYEEEILRTIAKRGRQQNISFFAFTATPKYRTLEVFGHPGPDSNPRPFHLYTMRQAIEEGFILDVLQNYATYEAYYRLQKVIEENPEVVKRKAARALVRYVSLHERNIAEKTKIMVEHFMQSTRKKIGGKAKAMVVTPSRRHVVRYRLAFDKYISEKSYPIKALVAFSGKVVDPDIPGKEFTEVGMNDGIKERQLREKFATDEYQILIVAEKYQTGFDAPLLHTMFVDKRLAGLQAVQTLSRLNRTCPGKEDTFILDFVNNPEEIQAAFQPYYEQTLIGERAHYRQLYELLAKLDAYMVYSKSEVEEFSTVFYKPQHEQTPADHARMNACIDPAVGHYNRLGDEEREVFRKTLVAYRNLYAFLSQVMPFKDLDLEKLYSYIRFLLMKLPRGRGPSYSFDDEVALEYYRLQKTSEAAIELQEGVGGEVSGPVSVGTGVEHREKIELSRLIDILNERFGTDFTSADQLFFDTIKAEAFADTSLRQAALVNTPENFNYVFREKLQGLVIDHLDLNEDVAAKFLNEEEFEKAVVSYLSKEIFDQFRREGAEEAA